MNRRKILIAASVIAIALSCASISHSILNELYGRGHVDTVTITTVFENYGQTAMVEGFGEGTEWGPYEFSVTGVENIEGKNLRVYLASMENIEAAEGEPIPVPPALMGAGEIRGYYWYSLEVPDVAWQAALKNMGPVTSTSQTRTSETKPIDVLPISSIIGVTAGLICISAVWVRHRYPWGDAITTLFEHDLTNMTIRDVKIFGEIMELEEFTIPQLMKQTKSSKITVWRALQKLIERGLVQPTEKSIPSSNGLGGRGKPSRIYRYVGKKQG